MDASDSRKLPDLREQLDVRAQCDAREQGNAREQGDAREHDLRRQRDLQEMPDLRELLGFAVESAQLAGAFTLGYFNAGTPHELKADRTPVTAADRGAEERLRARIAARYPAHSIVGEELGEQPGLDPRHEPRHDSRREPGHDPRHEPGHDSPREPGRDPRRQPGLDSRGAPARWILDPIDGTQSFICGVPLYSVLVGFEWCGEMVAGVLHLPALGETIYAARGLGCFWNGRPARVSGVSELAQARLSFTSTKMMVQHGQLARFERLRDACLVDRGWSDAYGYALLATGRVDIVLDPCMALWDNAALLPIVTEAGGTFTDWTGRPTHTAKEALATNGHLLAAVLGLLK